MSGTVHLSLVPGPVGPVDSGSPVRPDDAYGDVRRAARARSQSAKPERGGRRFDGSRSVPLRLTRRGRLLILAIVLVGALGGGVLLGAGSSRASGEAAPPREYRYVVVQPGDTLWGIARAADPGADPRATIERIRTLNALSSASVQVGQRIALP